MSFLMHGFNSFDTSCTMLRKSSEHLNWPQYYTIWTSVDRSLGDSYSRNVLRQAPRGEMAHRHFIVTGK